MSFRRTLALSLLLGVVAPVAARADTLAVPFVGINFGGNSGRDLSRAINADRFDWGVSLAYMGGGILGVEADVAHSPDFFGKSDIAGSSVLTATGNLVIGVPIGGQTGIGFRPYVLGGLGVIRSKVDVLVDSRSFAQSDSAWSFGGGAMFFFGTHVGLRADLRYFRTFGRLNLDLIDIVEKHGRLDFARASAGFILRF
jgi:opacity protein-like surface antigen